MRLHLVVLAFLPACTSFANVRSARVRPGTSIDIQSSFASNPGDAAGWLLGNNIDCAERCGGGIVGGELGVAHGFTRRPLPFTLGAGLMGLMPYGEGYVQLGGGAHPAGIGARIGIPPRARVRWRRRTRGSIFPWRAVPACCGIPPCSTPPVPRPLQARA